MNKFYKAVRILTIPPIVVSILLIQLIINKTIDNFFAGFLLIVLLGIIPILSYPINKIFKGDRKKERKLAFVFTFLSYGAGFIYALLANIDNHIKFIYYVYFFSVILLAILNIFFTNASGHMASLTGLVFLSFNSIGYYTLLYTIPIYLITFLSSIKLKRHTAKELLLGTLTIVVSYFFTWLIL